MPGETGPQPEISDWKRKVIEIEGQDNAKPPGTVGRFLYEMRREALGGEGLEARAITLYDEAGGRIKNFPDEYSVKSFLYRLHGMFKVLSEIEE